MIDGLVKGGAMQDDRHVVAISASKQYVSQDAGVLARVVHVQHASSLAEQRAA